MDVRTGWEFRVTRPPPNEVSPPPQVEAWQTRTWPVVDEWHPEDTSVFPMGRGWRRPPIVIAPHLDPLPRYEAGRPSSSACILAYPRQ